MATESKTNVTNSPHASGRGMRLFAEATEDHRSPMDRTDERILVSPSYSALYERGTKLTFLRAPRQPVDARSSSQVLVEKGNDLGIGVEPVLQFGEAVALVLVEQILDGAAVLVHTVHDLLGFTHRHARVVLSVHDHERGRDVFCLVNGAYGLEELAVLLQRAVLGLAQRAAVAARVLEEGDEVGDPHDVYARRPQVRILRKGRQHHEPAVGAAHYADAPVAALPEPVRRMREVLHRVHPQPYVVEVGVGLAVPRRAAYVGGEHGVAPTE